MRKPLSSVTVEFRRRKELATLLGRYRFGEERSNLDHVTKNDDPLVEVCETLFSATPVGLYYEEVGSSLKSLYRYPFMAIQPHLNPEEAVFRRAQEVYGGSKKWAIGVGINMGGKWAIYTDIDDVQDCPGFSGVVRGSSGRMEPRKIVSLPLFLHSLNLLDADFEQFIG